MKRYEQYSRSSLFTQVAHASDRKIDLNTKLETYEYNVW